MLSHMYSMGRAHNPLCLLQTRTEGKVQEATDQVCEQSLMQQVLQETQSQVREASDYPQSFLKGSHCGGAE